MQNRTRKQEARRPDSAPQGHPSDFAPDGGPQPGNPEAVTGQTMGHAAADDEYDSGEADLTSTIPNSNTDENERDGQQRRKPAARPAPDSDRKYPLEPGTGPNVHNENMADDHPVVSDDEEPEAKRGEFRNRPGARSDGE